MGIDDRTCLTACLHRTMNSQRTLTKYLQEYAGEFTWIREMANNYDVEKHPCVVRVLQRN